MRLKLNKIIHVKWLVEYLAFIKCSINAAGSNLNIQVPICLKSLCLWIAAYVICLANLEHEEKSVVSILTFPNSTGCRVVKILQKCVIIILISKFRSFVRPLY